jgi:hypothetical protein
MRAFGIVLLVLSLLGIAGSVYLGVQDWRGRQTIEAAGLRHLLLLNGLPLGNRPIDLADMPTDAEAEIPFAVQGPGGAMTETVSPELLKAYFQAASGGAAEGQGVVLTSNAPVPNQLAEVRRVYGVIKAALNAIDGPAAKAPVAYALLVNQAETWDERLDIMALRDAANGNELVHLLDLKFYGVNPKLYEGGALNPEGWAGSADRIKELEARRAKLEEEANADKESDAGRQKQSQALALAGQIERRRPQPPRDETELRNRLSHLLAHLDLSAAWQKRVMMVVGVRQYVHTIAAQAVRLAGMIARVDQATADDQERFVADYGALRALAITRTQQALELAEVRSRLQDQAVKDQDVVNQRELQLNGLKAELVKVKGEVNDLLARQTVVEKALFDLERIIGQTLADVYQMEADLARIQRERYEKAKQK